MMNQRIREFREKLIDLTDEYADIPVEAQYMATQLVLNMIVGEANRVILQEMEEEKCKKLMQE